MEEDSHPDRKTQTKRLMKGGHKRRERSILEPDKPMMVQDDGAVGRDTVGGCQRFTATHTHTHTHTQTPTHTVTGFSGARSVWVHPPLSGLGRLIVLDADSALRL